ncbi:hypothetical protein D3C83_192800 [compost metagenome]
MSRVGVVIRVSEAASPHQPDRYARLGAPAGQVKYMYVKEFYQKPVSGTGSGPLPVARQSLIDGKQRDGSRLRP